MEKEEAWRRRHARASTATCATSSIEGQCADPPLRRPPLRRRGDHRRHHRRVPQGQGEVVPPGSDTFVHPRLDTWSDVQPMKIDEGEPQVALKLTPPKLLLKRRSRASTELNPNTVERAKMLEVAPRSRPRTGVTPRTVIRYEHLEHRRQLAGGAEA